MEVKLTNNGHRKGFVQGHSIAPGASVILKDVVKEELKQLEQVQWLEVEKVEKPKEKKEDKKINAEVHD